MNTKHNLWVKFNTHHTHCDRITQFLLAVLIFLLPSNLFFKLDETAAYVHGRLIDYLIPRLYVTDLVIGSIIIVGLLNIWLQRRAAAKSSNSRQAEHSIATIRIKRWILPLAIILLAAHQLWSPVPTAAVWYLCKLGEMGALWWVIRRQKWLTHTLIRWSLAVTVIFQSLLAIFQFYAQRPLLGYIFLGEPDLLSPVGITTNLMGGIQHILPYGTTSHPNVLAGILTTYILLLIYSRISKKLLVITAIPGLYALWLTQSVSAWLALVAGLLLVFLFHRLDKSVYAHFIEHKTRIVFGGIILSALTPVIIYLLAHQQPHNQSLVRRMYLNQAALRMIIDRPIWGVGLNQFTSQLEQYSTVREVVRFIQPVHHALILWLAETGLIGVVIMVMWWKKYGTSEQLAVTLALLPIISLDHYLLTQQQGLLLLTLILTLSNQRRPT